MMDIEKLKELVELMVANDLSEVDLESEGEHIKLTRDSGRPEVQYITAPPAAMPAATPAATISPATGDPGQPAAAPADHREAITSPMVGTFYAASSPDAQPFVATGQSVKVGDVVCIIEAMKVFNEIKAEQAGVIDEVLVENGQAVEFGQPLFYLK